MVEEGGGIARGEVGSVKIEAGSGTAEVLGTRVMVVGMESGFGKEGKMSHLYKG